MTLNKNQIKSFLHVVTQFIFSVLDAPSSIETDFNHRNKKTKFICFKLQPHVIFKNCYIHTIYFHGKVNRTTKQNASLLFKLLFFVDFLNMHIIGHKCAKCCTLLNVFSLNLLPPMSLKHTHTHIKKNPDRSKQNTYITKRNDQLNS